MDIIDETGTFYIDNFEYGFNGCDPGIYWIDKIYNSEGYCNEGPNNYSTYYYYRKDHLGNNREVWRTAFTAFGTTYPATTIQRTQYYPSGLPWAEGEGASVQNKKYNGKEWIEAHGLDEYYSQARMYYPAIMRTTTIDPLAEKYYSISPYAWCGNNPVNRIDPDGMDDYKINSDGRIWLWRETKDMTDRLIAIGNKNVVKVDESGKILNNNITVNDRSILPALSQVNADDQSFASTSSKEVGGLFLFAANNSNVEWNLGGYKTVELNLSVK